MATTTASGFPVLVDNSFFVRDTVVEDAIPGPMAGELVIETDDYGQVMITVAFEDQGASIYVSPEGAEAIIARLTSLL